VPGPTPTVPSSPSRPAIHRPSGSWPATIPESGGRDKITMWRERHSRSCPGSQILGTGWIVTLSFLYCIAWKESYEETLALIQLVILSCKMFLTSPIWKMPPRLLQTRSGNCQVAVGAYIRAPDHAERFIEASYTGRPCTCGNSYLLIPAHFDNLLRPPFYDLLAPLLPIV